MCVDIVSVCIFSPKKWEGKQNQYKGDTIFTLHTKNLFILPVSSESPNQYQQSSHAWCFENS